MPTPVSVTQIATYWPGCISRWRAARSSSQVFALSMVSRPPSGIASRALIHRFNSAFSSSLGSIGIGGRLTADLKRRETGLDGLFAELPIMDFFCVTRVAKSGWQGGKTRVRWHCGILMYWWGLYKRSRRPFWGRFLWATLLRFAHSKKPPSVCLAVWARLVILTSVASAGNPAATYLLIIRIEHRP
jgi:hypothetical protein